LRDNGAVEGGSGGFTVGDEVILIRKFSDNKIYVMAHTDGIKPCGDDLIIIILEISGKAKKSVLVWDPEKNAVADKIGVVTPCDYDDAKFTSWYSTIKKDTVSDLFSSVTYYQRTEQDVAIGGMTESYSSSIPSSCQLLVPGANDTVNVTVIDKHVTQDYVINTYGDLNPYPIFKRPVSSIRMHGSEAFGLRVSRTTHSDTVTIDGFGYTYDATSALRFFGPFNQTTPLGILDTTLSSSYPDVGDGHHAYRDLVVNKYIPTPPLMFGVKGKKCVTDISIHHFVPCNGSYDYSVGTYSNVLQTADADPVIYVNSQALFFEDDYKDEALIPYGDNPLLSAQIITAIRLLLTLNAYAQNAMPYYTITLEVTK
jgi:hypothetical protein